MSTHAPEVSRLLVQVPPHYRRALLAAGLPIDRLPAMTPVPVGPSARHTAAILLWLVAAPGAGWGLDAALASHAAPWLAVPPAWLAWIPWIVVVALNLHVFSNNATLVHAAGHSALFPGRRVNNAIGSLLAACNGFSRLGSAAAHFEHHVHLNTAKDPDRIWGAPDESARHVVLAALRELLLWTAFRRLLQYWWFDARRSGRTAGGGYGAPGSLGGSVASALGIAAVQAAILGLYTATLGPLHYVCLYVGPLVTLYPAIIRLRCFVEHAFAAGARPVTPEAMWVTRNAHGPWLERFLVGPPDLSFHYEHHVFPFLPYAALPESRGMLAAAGASGSVEPSVLGYVRRRLREERALRRADRVATDAVAGRPAAEGELER